MTLINLSTLGLVHMVFGLLALFAGTFVVLRRKGTRFHRAMGHLYLNSMLALNISALFLYRLTGTFNFFHLFALMSLALIVAGMVPVFWRRPRHRWLELHAQFITGSYIGVVAATAAEVTSRIPGVAFGPMVGVTSFIVIGIGTLLMIRFLESSLDSVRPARRAGRAAARRNAQQTAG